MVGVSLKLHLGYEESRTWMQQVRAHADRVPEGALFVLPSFPLLPLAADLFVDTGIRYGAQNAHSAQRGAFTDEVSPAMLAELGCTHVEIGHAERRALFGETDAVVAAKMRAVAEVGLTPVLCVGEQQEGPLAEAIDVVRTQLDRALVEFPIAAPLIVAYEPVWAIGVDNSAPSERIAAVTGAIRESLDAARHAAVLYGGSTAAGVYRDLVRASAQPQQVPDGLFVGRAAHDVAHLLDIVEEVIGHGSTQSPH